MQGSTLKVEVREKKGKSYARKLRNQGKLPAILYGAHLKENILLELDLVQVRRFFSGSARGDTGIIRLELVGQKENREREVIIRDIQYNWLKEGIEHIDFYEVTRGEKVSTTVPLHLVGKAAGAKEGGVVEQWVREVEIECLPRSIPSHLELKIDSLGIGDSLLVKDIEISPEVKVITNSQERVVSIIAPVSEEELEKAEVAVTPEEVEVVGKEEKIEEEESPEGKKGGQKK